MTTTVIVPHFGSDALLDACVASLHEHAPDAAQVIWDGNTANHGFAGNCNRAAQLASTKPDDVLVFLNNDCTVRAGWLEPLVYALGSHPIAGSLLFYPDGTIQHSGVTIIRGPNGVEGRNLTYWHPSGEIPAVTGASLAIKAGLFWQVGGFDEGFYNGNEDVDLCLKATEATGLPCWFAAESTATHLESASGDERWVAVHKNIVRLNERWGDQ